MQKNDKKILIILVIALLFIDQILKIIFLTTDLKIGNADGVSLGIIERKQSENNITYILISFVALFAIIRYIKSNNTFIKMNSRIILSFTMAGILSNVIDRIWSKGTINYINIPKFTSINLGYVYFFITWIGLAVILTKHTSNIIKDKKK